jgi:hypothetical protein
MAATKPRAARRQFSKLNPAAIESIRYERAAGHTCREIAMHWNVSASFVSQLCIGASHVRDADGPLTMKPARLPRAAQRKILQTALDERRIYGGEPTLKAVGAAVIGEPKRLQGRKLVRVQRLLSASLRVVDRILENVGPKNASTGCALWTAGCRERVWTNKDGTKRKVRYPFAVAADGHSLEDPKRVLLALASRYAPPRARIRMKCGDLLRCETKHMVVRNGN